MKGKTVLITGAAKGIGADIARRFAKAGATIVLNYRSNLSDELLDELKSMTIVKAIKGDVSDFIQSEALVKETIGEFKTIDVLVNNAGITKDSLLLRMSESDFDDVININLKGTFNMIKHVSKHMLKQKSGKIINISSVIGLIGNIGQANYAASKAGIIGLTKSAAKELGSRNITCNAIAPGFIETDMTGSLPDDIRNGMLRSIPLGRFGKGTDVADVAFFLASSDYITGQVINIDGGMVM